MAKLKLGIQRVDNIVFGKVLEQDEKLRGGGDLYDDGEIVVCSEEGPELLSTALFVCGGDSASDNDWFACAYPSASAAEKIVEAIKHAVAAINSGCPKTDSDDCGLEIVE